MCDIKCICLWRGDVLADGRKVMKQCWGGCKALQRYAYDFCKICGSGVLMQLGYSKAISWRLISLFLFVIRERSLFKCTPGCKNVFFLGWGSSKYSTPKREVFESLEKECRGMENKYAWGFKHIFSMKGWGPWKFRLQKSAVFEKI